MRPHKRPPQHNSFHLQAICSKLGASPIDQGGVKRSCFVLCMVGRLKSPHAMMRSTRLSRQQYQLHYRGIPDMRSTYMCYQHSTLCASHSCECTASSAWWGFTNARDQQKHDAFIRRSQRSRFVLPNLPSFAELCRTADERLFNQILSNKFTR